MWIRNRTTTHRLNGKTPYEAFYGVKPDTGDIHLWGSHVWVRDLTAGKLDPRGREGRFVGYDAESKGCRVYWPNSRSIGVERDLIFEDRSVNSELIFLPEPAPVKNRPPAPVITAPLEMPKSPDTQPPKANPDPPESSNDTQATPESAPDKTSSTEPASTEITSDANETGPPVETEPPTKLTGRIRKPSRYVREVLDGTFDGGTARGKSRLPRGVQPPTGMTAAADETLNLELESELKCESATCLAHENQTIEIAMANLPDIGVTDNGPKSLAEAKDEEMALVDKYEVWDKVDQPEDTDLVGCRWVFRIKRDANGKILKYRARLVAQGFTQLYGIDFYETFAPVARLSSIRTVIALAGSEDWELHQMDVKSAYLNSPIGPTPPSICAYHPDMAAKARSLV